ncbi:MAG TPA: hypothetical protein VFB39_05985 [Solirubrobacteraceae bacterium]|nr:hypothetical protein [Solirubrobacteraceae bacterium]
MRIPLYLAIAQWALLLALGLLVIGAYRQLGRVFAGKRPAGALGPAPGSSAKEFDYLRIRDNTNQIFVPAGNDGPALLGFVDPTCPACEELVENLSAADASGELAGFRTLLVMSDPPAYAEISPAFCSTAIEIGRPPTEAARQAYNAIATPLLIAIDGEGVIRAARTATERKDIRALIHTALAPTAADEVGVTIIDPDKAVTATADIPAQAHNGGRVT